MPLDNAYVISTSKLTAIGDAIRGKIGSSSSMTLDEMATEIANISGGGSAIESGTFTGNGSKTISITMQNNPSHVMIYSPFADFGTKNAWNTAIVIYNVGESYYALSFYGSSNMNPNRKDESNISYANGTWMLTGLQYATRSGKTYYWFAW